MKIGSVNVKTMEGRGGEVVNMAARRLSDFCYLWETGWKEKGGVGARRIEEREILHLIKKVCIKDI